MAFPTTGVLDAFTRADEGPPPSTSWTTPTGVGGLQVISNACAPNASGGSVGMWNPTTYGPASECYASIPVKPSVDTNIVGVYARMVSTASVATMDGYSITATVAAGTDTIHASRIDNGTGTTLGASVSQEFASGDGIGIEVVGSTITIFYRNGAGAYASLGTRTDSTYSAAGQVGAAMSGSTAGRIDDFGGGTQLTFEQEGFRFRNDDGSESAATWRQAQDVNDSIAKTTTFRLRALINTSGDAPSEDYQLQYRKTNSLDWRKVQ